MQYAFTHKGQSHHKKKRVFMKVDKSDKDMEQKLTIESHNHRFAQSQINPFYNTSQTRLSRKERKERKKRMKQDATADATTADATTADATTADATKPPTTTTKPPTTTTSKPSSDSSTDDSDEQTDVSQVQFAPNSDERVQNGQDRSALILPGYKEWQNSQYPDKIGGVGTDQYRSYYVGQFYWIQSECNQQGSNYGKRSFYINRNAIYFTNPPVSNDKADNYRNVEGSIDFGDLTNYGDNKNSQDDKMTKQGNCCQFLSVLKPFVHANIEQSESSDDIQEKIRQKLVNHKVSENRYGLQPAIRNIIKKGDRFYWQNLICFEIRKKGCYMNQQNGNGRDQIYWTICGSNPFDISAFKNIIREYYILHQYQKEGISHISFILDREFKEQSSSTGFRIQDYKWSYDNENSWGEQCTAKNHNGHIRSPIVFDESLMKSDVQLIGLDKKKQLESIRQKMMKTYSGSDDNDNDNGQQKGRQISQEEQTYLQSLYDDNIMKIDFINPSEQADDYLNIFTFNGLHENLFIGDFGSIKLQFRKDEDGIKLADSYSSAENRVKSDQVLKIFALTFKTAAEHSVDNYSSPDAEIQFYLYPQGDEKCEKWTRMSNRQNGRQDIYKDSGELMQIVLKQFFSGKVKDESDDLYLAEYYMTECTKYVLTVPLVKRSNLQHSNYFVTGLVGQDMFDLQPSPDYLNEYLNMNLKNILFSRDVVTEFVDSACKYPGNLQCLLDQQRNQQSFYIYKGTSSKPPCQSVTHIVMKNAFFISASDYSSISEQMFAYRTNKKNTRSSIQVTQDDVNTFQIQRVMDYRMDECEPKLNIKTQSKSSTTFKSTSFTASDFKSYNSQTKNSIQQQQSYLSESYNSLYKNRLTKENEYVSDFFKSGSISIRRMGFINPKMADGLLKLGSDSDGKDTNGYQHAKQGLNSGKDYGGSTDSILYVNGQLKTTVSGMLTTKEVGQINKVIQRSKQKFSTVTINKLSPIDGGDQDNKK